MKQLAQYCYSTAVDSGNPTAFRQVSPGQFSDTYLLSIFAGLLKRAQKDTEI